MTPELFAAAAQLCRTSTPVGGYGLAYGSQAVGAGYSDSDLDLVLVGRHRPGYHIMNDLVAAVCKIHDDFGLRTDTEVDYETKLFATFADVDSAVGLRCFSRISGVLSADPVVADRRWLNSPAFAQRLILNALTSEHVFLGGSVARYRADRARAEQAIAVLAISMLGVPEVTVLDAVRALTEVPGGVRGKDFLGYTPGARLCSTVQSGLASLVARNLVEVIGGTRFRRCHVRDEQVGPGHAA
ncbi:hypothetical protein ASD42_31000 [Nocardia sp. Root136]|uniref:hypothetical protein n=1 Tax=Nocardia sp. Root136 TaxID=1736458 RepID=UPI0006F89CA3|nr:hypothetical protein [Nocardia sp. Root136]KQY36824.1 hypothetical protein ASD42_31000 [Nocardia sp. Root136]